MIDVHSRFSSKVMLQHKWQEVYKSFLFCQLLCLYFSRSRDHILAASTIITDGLSLKKSRPVLVSVSKFAYDYPPYRILISQPMALVSVT